MPKEFDTKEQKEYVEKQGAECPFCGSRDIFVSDDDSSGVFEGTTSWKATKCDACGKEWDDVFHLVGFQEIKE